MNPERKPGCSITGTDTGCSRINRLVSNIFPFKPIGSLHTLCNEGPYIKSASPTAEEPFLKGRIFGRQIVLKEMPGDY